LGGTSAVKLVQVSSLWVTWGRPEETLCGEKKRTLWPSKIAEMAEAELKF